MSIEEKDDRLFNDLMTVVPHVAGHKESYHYNPRDVQSRIARAIVRFLAECADFLFKERYGHRAVVLETIASVPGMIGGGFQHLKSLRLIRDDRGWIQTLLNEAENERMHLLIYSSIAQPTQLERLLIIVVQFFFSLAYFFLYFISPATAHRVVGFLEEEAIRSYEHYLRLVEDGTHVNIDAPPLAISYWSLAHDAKLTDVIKATIKDEMVHRDVNHTFANDTIGTSIWS